MSKQIVTKMQTLIRSKGIGGRFYRGRGRGRFNGEIDTSRITCFRCEKVGHFAMQCMDRLLELQEDNRTTTQKCKRPKNS